MLQKNRLVFMLLAGTLAASIVAGGVLYAWHDNAAGFIQEKLAQSVNQFDTNILNSARADEPDAAMSFPAQVQNAGFAWGSPVFMRIFKQERTLEVWLKKDSAYVLFRSYPICSYSGNLGPKLAEGDRQAPEGFYHVRKSSLNPNSRYHLSFNLGYPNRFDRSHGRTGSYLMVHGDCVSIGCYAMTDAKIEEIYGLAEAALNNGQAQFQVQAFPFRMTDENLAQHTNSEWYDFWLNLQEGYQAFEQTQQPPKVSTQNKRYVIQPQ